ncbi:hypothetical protein FEAC_28270 [Ferrimicrobium acidiphilum DSM 19497]|uniref:Uncharacterized protein n=1 Tax=Ferrimicrobium acidiphilum DSM 19497 TaxID=1121877 RepID=A0A0D8FQN7_9ACTN|nr:hypothetical protein FEAC_28270 [Ferrimicrobium acidiphilum DSM 19497]
MGNRLTRHGLFEECVEQQASAARVPAVKSEHPLVEVGLHVLRADRALHRSHDPAFDE